MTSDACREMRGPLAAAAIGRIDSDDDIALGAHLDGCAPCRAELRSLASVARALELADPGHIGDELPRPARELSDQVLARVAALRESRRRRVRTRTALAAAAAIAVAVLVAVVLAVPESEPRATTVVFPAAAGVEGDATLHAQDAGTEVELRATGLQAGEVYWLWLTGDDGDRVTAGTFVGTPHPVDVTMTAALGVEDTRRIWVTDEDDAVVLDARLPR